MTASSQTEQTVRLSLAWVLGLIVIIFTLGILGGFVGQQFLRPPLPPLTSNGEQLVTTVQEVTISPNQAAAELVNQVERSVLLVGRADLDEPEATAFVVTNDGLLVTAADLPTGSLVAFDNRGRRLAVTVVGRDELFGLTYLRMADSVVVPLDVRRDDVAVGELLLGLSRSDGSFEPRVVDWRMEEHVLPASTSPAGVHRLLRGPAVDRGHSVGMPLLDEEGRVAGLLLDPTSGSALPARQLQESFSRIIENRREDDPFERLGLAATYTFAADSESGVRFVAPVLSVVSNGEAARAGIRRGDVITALDGEPLQWEGSALAQFSAAPLQVTLERAGEEIVVGIGSAATP